MHRLALSAPRAPTARLVGWDHDLGTPTTTVLLRHGEPADAVGTASGWTSAWWTDFGEWSFGEWVELTVDEVAPLSALYRMEMSPATPHRGAVVRERGLRSVRPFRTGASPRR